MKVAVIGNGPSWDKYDGWGDAVVGCNLGAPIGSKYNFTVTAARHWLKDRILKDFWDYKPKTKMYFSPHVQYYIQKYFSKDERDVLLKRINGRLMNDVYNLPRPFQLDLKNILAYNLDPKRQYFGNLTKDFNTTTTGHWSIIYAIHFLKATHVKCWGFDAHLDFTTKSDTLSLEYGHEQHRHELKKSHEHLELAKSWPITLNFIKKVYPSCEIELVQ
jgi:hypothetical protein